METDFLNFKDDTHFVTLSSPIYDHCMLEDSESSLLDIIKDEYQYGQQENATSFWENETELNEGFAYPSLEPHRTEAANSKEDFQKMLTDWQEHLGSLQASDTEDLDMSMGLGHNYSVPEQLPDAIFEEECPSVVAAEPSSAAGRSLLKPKQERLGTSCAVYGMKAGGRDARLPVMEDSSGEDTASMLLTLTPSKEHDLSLHLEEDDDCIDIETVTEQIPVLEAGDLKSLLEQFEASEAVNTSANVRRVPLLQAMVPSQQPANSRPAAASSDLAMVLTHQKIKDSLPQEIIDKIRASSLRKKVIPLIPAMPSKRLGKGTRMQDAAATLSRNKLLKLVSGSAGDTVQLDHDYCTILDCSPAVNFYHCDANEYSNRGGGHCVKPEQRTVVSFPLSPQCLRVSECKPEPLPPQLEPRVDKIRPLLPPVVVTKTDCWEKNAKKDSGLESGEVSDASEEVIPTSLNIKIEPDQQQQPTKKKLNLEEYRSRREELERLRAGAGSQGGSDSGSCLLSPTPSEEVLTPFTPVTVAPLATKPAMHSVEVQTQDTCAPSDADARLGRARDHRGRRYRSRRSQGSSSSGSSCSPDWKHRQTQQSSWQRRKPRPAATSRVGRNSSNFHHKGASDATSPRSSSHCSSCTSSPSRSRSRSRSRACSSKGRPRRPTHAYARSASLSSRKSTPRVRSHAFDWNRRSCSPGGGVTSQGGGGEWQLTERERKLQVEERRVIYVGRLPEGTTKNDLRKRFEVFGPILDISVHFRERGDNYGFVTFAYKIDAYEAVEHGNGNPSLPVYDLCFGGRRTFCKVEYSDLDAQNGYRAKAAAAALHGGGSVVSAVSRQQESFDRLLREAQSKLQKRGKL